MNGKGDTVRGRNRIDPIPQTGWHFLIPDLLELFTANSAKYDQKTFCGSYLNNSSSSKVGYVIMPITHSK